MPHTIFAALVLPVIPYSHMEAFSDPLIVSSVVPEHLGTDDTQIRHLAPFSLYFSFILLLGPYLDIFDI